MEVKSFIAYYMKIVLNGDLKKMLAVAEASQEVDRREALTLEMSTPAATTASTTMSPNSPSFYNNFNSDRARCAVPIAMTLFSVIDVMGTLLKSSYNENAKESIEKFFEYAHQKGITSYVLSEQDSGVIYQVFRNGCMHSFFPFSMKIKLDLSDTEPKPLQPDDTTRTITLNVNFLQKMVVETVNTLFSDDSLHPAMQDRLNTWITATYDSGKTKARLDEFWIHNPS